MFPFTNPYRGYPPPSNKDYAHDQSSRFVRASRAHASQKFWLKAALQDLDLTINQKHVVSFSLTIAKTSSTTIRTPAKMSYNNRPPLRDFRPGLNQLLVTQPKRSRKEAEAMADTIKWKRYDFTLETAESNGPIYPMEAAREDLIKELMNGEPYQHCDVCKRDHIMPGPICTIACRDPCGSRLPRWFPRNVYPRPWEIYNGMNAILAPRWKYEDNTNIFGPKRYHQGGKQWTAMGKVDGCFWECRQGPTAIQAELDCQLCRQPMHPRDVQQRVKKWQDFRDNGLKAQVDDDKAAATTMIRARSLGLLLHSPGPPTSGPTLTGARVPNDDGHGEDEDGFNDDEDEDEDDEDEDDRGRTMARGNRGH